MSGSSDFTLAFAGNPNCGKSTLFNSLTGARQQIGNWPGVTVECIEGSYRYEGRRYRIVDLPGIYSLSPNSEDEIVSRDYILSGKPDLIVNIIDASNLARNLYLTAQLIEMQVPMLVVLNMMDLAEKNGYAVDIEHLSAHLKCPVIGISAVEEKDVERFRRTASEVSLSDAVSDAGIKYPNEIEELADRWAVSASSVSSDAGINPRWLALRLIEQDPLAQRLLAGTVIPQSEIDTELDKIRGLLLEEPDMVIADYVYGAVNGVCREVVKKVKNVRPVSDIIDSFVMSPVLGIPVFFCIMLLVFFVTIEVGNVFVDWFDRFAGFVFVDGFGRLLDAAGSPEWLRYMLAEGLGAGLQTVISFIPFVFFMFLMLSLLEDSGYMARAAFVMDKFMGKLGLPGKAFVPMIVGFGCTVPAILATRTLDNRRDRLMTIFMVPLMSCGARLPVYALFAAAFFPQRTGLTVFSLYIAGVAVAILSGLLVRHTMFKGELSHLIMELPRYHVPRAKHILLHTWSRVKDFIRRAGKVIVIAVFLLSVFSSIGLDGRFDPGNSADSLLAHLGRFITPVFTPMGISRDNWPATVGLFTGVFAKESIVGTLNALYSQMAGGSSAGLLLLKEHFTDAAAYAYLLFVLIYMPCIAAVAASIREAGVRFGLLQALYLTVLAWIVSTLFYQIAEGRNIVYGGIAAGLLVLVAVIFIVIGKAYRRTES